VIIELAKPPRFSNPNPHVLLLPYVKGFLEFIHRPADLRDRSPHLRIPQDMATMSDAASCERSWVNTVSDIIQTISHICLSHTFFENLGQFLANGMVTIGLFY
jgi:hypothetical protein